MATTVDRALTVPRHAATLRTMVEDHLRNAILTGRFRPGQRLIERELCELLAVGRTSVREGLRQLEAEGLVDNVPHRGPSVSRIAYEEAEQLYAVRALLEGYAAEQFAELGTLEHMARLNDAVDAFALAVASGDQEAVVAAKTGFYIVMMEGCGNGVVRQLLSQLHNRVNILRITSMMMPGRLPHTLAEIREIQDAILARDAVRAGAAARRHIRMAARAMLAVLREGSVT